MTWLHNHILELEKSLLDPEVRQSAQRVRALLADGFFEFCSSGRIYHYRNGGVFAPVAGAVIQNFAIKLLSPESVLAAYTLTLGSGPDAKITLRSSVWKLIDDEWKIVFHQGTPAP